MRILQTERTYLRDWELSDLEALAGICSDDAVMRYLMKGSALTAEEAGERLTGFINHQMQHGFTYWAVVLKESGEVIGHAGLKWLANLPEIEVGYGLRRDQWGKGLATEVAGACLKWGFEQRRFERIIALTMHANVGSQRVLEKIGMRPEGEIWYRDRDWLLYGMGREEWMGRKETA